MGAVGEEAWVIPLGPFTTDGLANVQPKYPTTQPSVSPLNNTDVKTHTISRASYPSGIVLIPTDDEPTEIPALLPLIWTTNNSEEVDIGPDTPNPNGVVILFRT